MASGAGLMSFIRTLSGAFATSVVTTSWSDRITSNHAELVGLVDTSSQAMLRQAGMSADAALQAVDNLVTGQSVMLATNQMMAIIGIAFLLAGCFIWLAPKAERAIDPAAGGH
jgi:DHA2 family multidrug resistance protein